MTSAPRASRQATTDREAHIAGRLTVAHGWSFPEAALYFADTGATRADAMADLSATWDRLIAAERKREQLLDHEARGIAEDGG